MTYVQKVVTVDCSNYCKYPSTLLNQNVNEGTSQQRSVSADRKKLVENALNEYHKELVLKLLNTTAKGEVKTLTNLHFILGFSEHQILQVLENVASIFTLSDIYKSVEVWDERHAQKILSVISSVFEDVSCDKNWNGTHFDSNYEFDDEFMDEWDEILQEKKSISLSYHISLAYHYPSLMHQSLCLQRRWTIQQNHWMMKCHQIFWKQLREYRTM